MNLPKIDCPFEIQIPFRWNETFKVFYDNMDGEHKGLFDAIFVMNEKRSDAEAIKDLREKVKSHFEDEENDMKRAVEAGNLTKTYFDAHAASHNKYIAILSTFEPVVSDEAVDYAMKWLVTHIKKVDFHYKDKL